MKPEFALKQIERFYRLMLLIYPADFRDEYGDMMRLDFRDQLRDTLAQDGAVGLAGLCWHTLTDLFLTSIAEHLQPRKELSMSTLPETIDRYQIRSELSVGTTANIYLAHDPKFNRDIVLKVLSNNEESKSYVSYMQEEARLWSKLTHPSIPKVHDYVIGDKQIYIAMDYVEGKNLLDMLTEQKTALIESDVINWAIEICDFLTYMHTHESEPILFRDMKPSNVMINSDSHVQIVDFGIARQMPAGEYEAQWEGIGTEGYAPPEQYAGRVSVASDIYALGATLYHVLSGRDPRETHRQFLFHIYPPSQYNEALSPALEQVILKATEFKSRDRYQSAQEFKVALEACLD